jgi:hypothetical protein
MQVEIFKSIQGYEGIFEVSNLGNLRRVNNGVIKVLKPSGDGYGYLCISLQYNNIRKTFKIHKLVAMAFLNHKPCGHKLVIDHINDIKTDNRVENLQIITNRENSYKTQGKYSSQYKGVYLHKKSQMFIASIRINNKTKYIGSYKNEYDAHISYQAELKKLQQ